MVRASPPRKPLARGCGTHAIAFSTQVLQIRVRDFRRMTGGRIRVEYGITLQASSNHTLE